MRNDALGLFWRDEPPIKRTAAPKGKRTPPAPTWLSPDHLPGLAEATAFNVPMFTDDELILLGNGSRPGHMVFDIEIYKNYFLAAFKHVETGKVCYVESDLIGTIFLSKLQFILEKFTTIGFNSNGFDLPICAMALNGKTIDQMKEAVRRIIEVGENYREVLKSYKVKQPKGYNHIDLMEVAPLRASLKIYAGRMHAPRMQDLPFHPDTHLSVDQVTITRFYCINDLNNTLLMYNMLSQQLQLRMELGQQYNQDLRSKSDAQIAEYVISAEVAKLNGERATRPTITPGTAYRFKTPDYLNLFHSPLMQQALATVQNSMFIVADHGSIEMPAEVKELKITIGQTTYKMGIGGLHSTESRIAHVVGDDEKLYDVDAASFYPYIIMNQGLFPGHLGPNFLRVYKQLVDRRLAAKALGAKHKKEGDKVAAAYWNLIANSLKIVINGSYGKLGSKYSNLYAPDLLVQVTMSGQLSLLLLIEWLELNGIRVVSANTDGIVIKPRTNQIDAMNNIIKQWESVSHFEMEANEYKGLYSRDVNSYIAVKPDGTVKTKGAFANPWSNQDERSGWLSVNPSAQICVEAVEKLLTTGTPVAQTVRNCSDITKFVSVRAVKGGAVHVTEKSAPPPHKTKEELIQLAGYEPYFGGLWKFPDQEGMSCVSTDSAYDNAMKLLMVPAVSQYLGKAVRWYYATNQTGEMVYALSGNTVPKSTGAKPLMDLPTEGFPGDVDWDWYINEAEKQLAQIGYV